MNRGFSLLILCAIILSASSIAAHEAFAQSISATEPLTVSVSSDYPSPYSTVTVRPTSTLFDIAGSKVTAKVNGTTVYSGSGSTPIQVQVGGPGIATTIVLSVVNAGQTYTKTIVIRPETIALIAEPISTTHPFYAGKGLIGSEGRVRFVAMPDFRTTSGAKIDPSTLEYTWRMNDQILESDSGIGKSVLHAVAPQRYRDVSLSVTVQTSDGSLSGQASMQVSPAEPLIRLYVDDPLLGPWFAAAITGNTSMNGDEETYIGVPYYFSETPSYSWDINGTESSTGQTITVRSSGNGEGTANLSFTATQSDTNQTANSTMQVLFGQKGSLGLFGL